MCWTACGMIWPGWPDFTCWWATSRRARAACTTPPRCCARAACWAPIASASCPTIRCSTSSAISRLTAKRWCSTSRACASASTSARTSGSTEPARRRPGRRPGAAGAQRLAVQHRQAGRAAGSGASLRHENRYALIYANMVGGQDELVFDGASFALDAAGEPARGAADFAEGVNFVESTPRAASSRPRRRPTWRRTAWKSRSGTRAGAGRA